METSRLQLENISCDFCAELIERAVQSLPGISGCHVDFPTRQTTVIYDPQRTNLAAIQHALAAAGYIARPLDAPSG